MERTRQIVRLFASLLGAIAILSLVGLPSSFVSDLPLQAYLTKTKDGYCLLYQLSAGKIVAEGYATLDEAVNAASQKGYQVPRTGKRRRPIFEKTWITSSPEETVVYWKLKPYQDPLRIRFREPEEAVFFYQAFLDGAYSPSPTGHSVVFVRK